MLKIKDNVDADVLVKKYGFTKTVISREFKLYEFKLVEKDSITLIQRGDRSLCTVIPDDWDTDCMPISDVVFKLITDGLVERAGA